MDHCATWLEPTALLLLERRYGDPMRDIETVLFQYTLPFYFIKKADGTDDYMKNM